MFSRIQFTFFLMIAMISLLSITSVQADEIQPRKQAPEIHDYTVRLSGHEKRQRVKRHLPTE